MRICLLSAFFLLNCLLGTDSFAGDSPEVNRGKDIVFLGNSLTLRASDSKIGWNFDHGMAASSPEKDYAHQLVKLLGLPDSSAEIKSVYPVEWEIKQRKPFLRELRSSWSNGTRYAILQLGDNVRATPWHLANFFFLYDGLAEIAKNKSLKFICVSTWWRSEIIDFIIKNRCEASGGIYVFIGDIYSDPKNTDRLRVDFYNSNVDKHPKNWGMHLIAQRIYRGLAVDAKYQ